jgi:hypothetical protein
VGSILVQAAEMKPMSLSELLDRTFTLFRNRFLLFCGIMVIPEIAIMTCSLIVIVGFPIRIMPMAANPQDPFAVFRMLQSRILPTFIAIFAQLFFQAIALGAVTVTVSEIYLGRAVSIGGAYVKIQKKIPGLIGLIILIFLIALMFVFGIFVAVALVGGLAAAALGLISPILSVIVIVSMGLGGFVLAAWLMMRYAVSIPAFLLEGGGVLDSMTRSGTLTKGHRGRILGAAIVMYIVVFVVQLLFVMPFSILAFISATKGLLPLWIQVGQTVAAALAGTVAGPLFMITIALIYYDMRIRKEAFDLESMMGALKPSTDAAAPPPLQPAS